LSSQTGIYDSFNSQSVDAIVRPNRLTENQFCIICIVLYLYIYIALLAVQTNQKSWDFKKNGWKVDSLNIHSFITKIYKAPLQDYYSEALPTLAQLKRRVLRLE